MQMTRSEVPLCWWNSPAPLAEIPDFVSSDLCPPNSLVDYRISGLMQERVYIVQTSVRDTGRCELVTSDLKQRLIDTWATISQNVIDKPVGQLRKRLCASMNTKGHLLNWNLLFRANTLHNRLFFRATNSLARKRRCFASFLSQLFKSK